mgnify:CR=1 FL=1
MPRHEIKHVAHGAASIIWHVIDLSRFASLLFRVVATHLSRVESKGVNGCTHYRCRRRRRLARRLVLG